LSTLITLEAVGRQGDQQQQRGAATRGGRQQGEQAGQEAWGTVSSQIDLEHGDLEHREEGVEGGQLSGAPGVEGAHQGLQDRLHHTRQIGFVEKKI
jgi:hypothetical protein